MSKHRTDRCRDIAWSGTVLLSEVGSTLHGVTSSTTGDDLDLMGICIPPPRAVVGLEQFEQFEGRWHQDGTPISDGTRSGPGDTDLTVYSLRKWAKLAADGNPTVQLILFSPPGKVHHVDNIGLEIRDAAPLFVSKESGMRYRGYLQSQRQLMLGLRSGHTNRPELVAQYGIDLKAGYHAMRLGRQGVELMKLGGVTLPMPEYDRNELTRFRTGYYGRDSKEWCLGQLDHFDAELATAIAESELPEHPDRAAIDHLLVQWHQSHWSENHA